jgi:sulfide:quinone oxidoreductase
MNTLVILGGGTAGTMTANKLRGRLSADEWRIVVVDKNDDHDYQPGYLFVPFGINKVKQIRKSRQEFIGEGIDLEFGEIERVDADTKIVHLSGERELAYDYLVIATGTTPRPDQTPGMLGPQWRRSVHEFYTYEGMIALKKALKGFTGGRVVMHITELPIKCPVAPLEFVMLADDYFTKKGMRDQVEIVYVTPLDGAFTKPVASRELGGHLSTRGIKVETDFMIERVDQERKAIVSYDEREISYDLLVTVPLNMGADYVGASGLGDELNYVPVDKHTMQSTAYDTIFALGDGGNLPTSKAGSVAHFSVDVFADNFVELVAGRPMTHSFDGHANCFVESGKGKALLLDFNYETEPLTGHFPFSVGPMSLLKPSRTNHLGKLAFRHVYWNFLLPGRPLPLAADMSMTGKHVE